jgi:hypothetical protein
MAYISASSDDHQSVIRDLEKDLYLESSETVLLIKNESKHLFDNLKVFAKKSTNNFRV